MTTIVRVITVPARGAYDVDDLAALQDHPLPPGERYMTPGVTPGFQWVREPGQALSVGLVLDTGQIAWGDCVAVAYSGKGGRAPVFRWEYGKQVVEEQIAPLLEGQPLDTFRKMTAEVERLTETVIIERPLPQRGEKLTRRELFQSAASLLGDQPPRKKVEVTRTIHPAIRYGVSQALLQAFAIQDAISPCQVICRAWSLSLPEKPVPLHAQCGSDRFQGAEKMIARRIASLPHALADNIPEQIGDNGVKLIRYIRWLKQRIQELGGKGYVPTLHLDVHGALGIIHDQDLGQILGTLYALEQAADPFPLRIESPLIMDSREEQIETLRTLREYVDFRKMNVQVVADEWANTLEDIQTFIDGKAAHMIQIKTPDLGGIQHSVDAVLACKAGGVEAFLGGSCAETILSAQLTAETALAARPALLMAKPGMGVTEAISLTSNHMNRTLAELQLARPGEEISQGSENIPEKPADD